MTAEDVQEDMGSSSETHKATRGGWIGLGVIALACVLYVMDLAVLHLAIPRSIDLEELSWTDQPRGSS